MCSSKFRKEIGNESFPKVYEIYLLNSGESFWNLEGISEEKGLDELIRVGENKNKIIYFRTRKPTYCEKTGKFTLNFHGRAKKISIKNFILEDTKSGREVLVFGKNSDNIFNMEIFHPLTPFISFALIIPFFSAKS